MAIIVTALMYSGKPDPSWELTPEQEKKFKELLKEKREMTFEMSSLSLGMLGYKGFMVETINEQAIPKRSFCFDGILDFVDQRHPNYIDSDSKLETLLLETGVPHLNDFEVNYISSEIQKNSASGIASINKSLKPKLELMAIPPYEPNKWNYEPVLSHNNCYNYSNDKITNTFAQPGRGSGLMFSTISCADVSSAAQRDGQITVSNIDMTPVEGHFIALVIAPGYDYHWYRRDSNGLWSHKPGRTPVRNTDNNGNLISDPRTCNRGPYTDFCYFFQSIPSKTKIR